MTGNNFETLHGLVARYSPSGQESTASDWLVQRMLALGYDQAFIDPIGNAVGILGEGPRQVVLLGHIDTVPGEIPLRVADGWLYGRGAVDAKGPLAAFVDGAARTTRQTGWQLVVIGAVEEERNSEGARFAAGQYQPDFAIIGEPNGWQRVGTGYKGSAWAQLTVRRSQSHPAGGQESAPEAAVSAWEQIRTGTAALNEGRTRMFDQVLLSLRGIDSGEDGFEQWARLVIMARLPIDLPPEAWYERLAEMTGNTGELEPRGFAIPAYQCAKNTPLMRAFLSSIRSTGETPGFVLKSGTADLNIVGPAWEKHPNFGGALVYGPGDSALDHTPEERIELSEYHKAVAVVSGALENLMRPKNA